MNGIKDILHLRARELMWSYIPQEKVAISASRDELLTFLLQGGSESLGVLDHLGAVGLELWRLDLLHLNGNSSNLCVVRSALETGKHGKIYGVSILLSHKDHARTWASQGLVGCRGHHITVGEGVVHTLRRNKASDMSDVSHQIRAIVVCYLSELGIVVITWVGACTNDKQFWLELGNLLGDKLIVKQSSLSVNEVWF